MADSSMRVRTTSGNTARSCIGDAHLTSASGRGLLERSLHFGSQRICG